MKHILLQVILISFTGLVVQAQFLDKVKSGVADGSVKNPEAQLSQIKPTDPEYLDTKVYLMNRRYQSQDIPQARKHGIQGYRQSPADSDYKYFFYDKLVKNKLFFEAGLTEGSPYKTKSIFGEYARNYSDQNWFRVSAATEQRVFNVGTASGTTLGLGHVMILDKYSYLDTQLNFSGTNTFLPNYSFGNELFYNPNSNTFSAGVKYNSYNSSSSTLLILGWRYDFEPVYMGIKETLTLAETTPGYATKVYVGVKSQRHRTELGYTTGTSVEDSAVTKQVYFHQVDGSFNYRINLLTEIGFRISDYQSDSLNQRGYYLNILFKY